MTNMKAAAHHLAAKGRYGDTTLVHMSPMEMWALERMAPEGRLTRNPDTGLPEAFSLSSLLPMVVGLGATALTGGAAAPAFLAGMNPALVGAMASGLTSTAMTGDLGKGLMSGLMSYGLGSAVDSLANPATEAVTNAATNTTGQIGAQSGQNLASQALQRVGASAPVQQSVVANPASIFDSVGQTAPKLTGTDAIGAAFNNVTGPNGLGALKSTFIDKFGSTTLPLGLGLLGSMASSGSSGITPVDTGPSDKELQKKYPEQFPDDPQVRFPGSNYNPGTDPEFDYFGGFAEGGLASLRGNPALVYAKGGLADPDGARAAKENIAVEAKMALLDHHPKADEALARYAQTFGPEALDELKASIFKPGGRIRGAGGGLDDLIPGTIEGRRDVRLADGEFVVPADVVSMLGDGSTDHGVRKLHEMMDRVRVSKTGTDKQAKSLQDKKVLPA